MIADHDYQFEQLIGRGKYGEVWRVLHVTTQKQYAMKKLELLGQSTEEDSTICQEAELMVKLCHPNIVACHGYFHSADSHLCIVMQYCDGGDISTRLKQRKGELIGENQIMEWFIQVCMAVQYLHGQHILHRDLKTQNIFLTRSKFVKVGDFGIARTLKNGCDMAETFIGTPYYMSPELFANKPYNSKTDMWSLGCCLYEMMTLNYAFTASSLPSLMKKIAKGQISALPRVYSKDLTLLCKELLSPKPYQRPSANKVLKMPHVASHIRRFLQENRTAGDSVSNEVNTAAHCSAAVSKTMTLNKPETVADVHDACTENKNGVNSGHLKPSPPSKTVDSALHVKLNKSYGQDKNSGSNSDSRVETRIINSTLEENEEGLPYKGEASSPKPKVARKKRFLKERVDAKTQPKPDNTVPEEYSQQPKKTVKSKPVRKPRPLPTPPISAIEPTHQRAKKRVFFKGENKNGQLSDSSSTGYRPGSSTSASSLDEIGVTSRSSTLDSNWSSANHQARRKRRERSSMAVSSSIEMIRMQGLSGSLISRISPPQTLQSMEKNGLPPSGSSRLKPGATTLSFHPAFRETDSRPSESDDNEDIRAMVGLLNETLTLNTDELPPFSGHGGPQPTHHTSDAGVDRGADKQREHQDLYDWIDDEAPDIHSTMTERYKTLKRECAEAVGENMFHCASHILDSEMEDNMEAKLVGLLGRQKYDEYGLKILQLKFMKENLDGAR